MAFKAQTGFDANNKRIIGVASPTTGTDATNKDYVDAAVRGLDWKQEVIAASTGNVSLAAPGTTLDGITLSNPMRILLKDQTAPAENGIYVWTASGAALTRALDADSWDELSGSTVTVQRGTVNADRVYRITADDGGTLGTTAVTTSQVGGGAGKTAGNGLTEDGSSYNVGGGTGITVTADGIAVDTSVVTRKGAANCVATTNPQTFAHGLGHADVQVKVKEGNRFVYPDVDVDTTNITVDWGSAPTAAQYRVLWQG